MASKPVASTPGICSSCAELRAQEKKAPVSLFRQSKEGVVACGRCYWARYDDHDAGEVVTTEQAVLCRLRQRAPCVPPGGLSFVGPPEGSSPEWIAVNLQAYPSSLGRHRVPADWYLKDLQHVIGRVWSRHWSKVRIQIVQAHRHNVPLQPDVPLGQQLSTSSPAVLVCSHLVGGYPIDVD